MVEKFEMKHFDYEFFNKICVLYMNFLKKFSTKYTTYNHEFTTKYGMPKSFNKEILMRMEMLTKQIYDHYQFKTVDMKTIPIYYIRNFLTILDNVMEMMHEKMIMEYYGEKKVMSEVYMNIKQVKYELERFVNYRMYMNTEKMSVHFVNYLKMFTMQFEKLMMVEEYQFVMKDVCMRYVNFLEKFFFELNKYGMEYYPMRNMDTMYHEKMGSMTPFYYTRQMKY